MNRFNRAIIALLFFLSIGTAHAAPTYCNYGPLDPAPTVTDDAGGNTSDVTLGGSLATNCHGVVVGNDSTAALSTIWGSGWGRAAKDDVDTSSDESNTIGGLKWSILATSDDGFYSGNWRLTTTDVNGGAPSNLGDLYDLIFVLKAGNAFVSYIFEDVATASSLAGTWAINFINPASGQYSDMSHITLYSRLDTVIPSPVPEPSTYALMMAGLLAVGVMSRRRARQRA